MQMRMQKVFSMSGVAAGRQPDARERGVGWVVLRQVDDRLAACMNLIHHAPAPTQGKKCF